MGDDPRFPEAIRRFDEENGRDPNVVIINGAPHPQELLYAQWLTAWVLKLCPQASEALLLAARSQHICRWQIPRRSYELTRAGYLRWRSDLKQFHARKSADILREVGYPEDMITRVQELNLKRHLGRDPECQVLEDALCLVTLQYQFADLAARTDPDKMVSILRKTWKKMSVDARSHALALPLAKREKELLERALAPDEGET
ncbi:MAG: DUF4202 domain-containing protein [Verrucomicrobia bacterium]|nr:DUF4202 domain-containing protein [Verrucomicrobiota bacterium]